MTRTLPGHVGVFAIFLSGIVQTAAHLHGLVETPHAARRPLVSLPASDRFPLFGFVLRIFQTPELALLHGIIWRLRITDTIPFGTGWPALHTHRRDSCAV